MSQTLVIESNTKLADLYALNLHMYVGTDVVCKKGLPEGIDLLEVHPSIDLIICRSHIGEEKTALELVTYLEKNKRDIPVIVIGKEDELIKKAIFLDIGVEFKLLVQTTAKVLKVTPKAMANKEVPEYFPIPAHHLLNLDKCFCDVFISVRKSPEEWQYVKRFHAEDTLTREEILKYIEQGIQRFYVPQDIRLKFASKVSEQLIKKLESPDLPLEQRVQVTDDTTKIVRDEILAIGLSENTINIGRACIQSMILTAKTSKNLFTLLSVLLKNKTSYLFKHSQLTTFVSFHAIEHMEWGSPEQQAKLAFVSFFHDITLAEDSWAKVESKIDLENSDFSEDVIKKIDQHALKAAQIVEGHPSAPIGSSQIIKQHHGALRGIGFPETFNAELSPLATIFMVCEAFSTKVLQCQESDRPLNKDEIFREISAKFSKGKFKKVLTALKKLDF